jgi:GT2 family glycosyltransferase
MSPTYNERDNVDDFLQRVLAAVPSADVFIVDDNSPDGTGARVCATAHVAMPRQAARALRK